MALDTETMEGQPDRDTFLGVFYEHYVHWLVEPFWAGDVAEGAYCNPPPHSPHKVDRDEYMAQMTHADTEASGNTLSVPKFCVVHAGS